jgi:uncharacterized membrane protein
MHLIISTFDAAKEAEQVGRTLEKLSRQTKSVNVERLAIVERRPDGQIGLSERNDWREQIGSTLGAVAGTLTSFLYAFVGLIGPSTGAAVAETAANAAESLVRDMGFPDDALYALGERLQAGQTALIALIDRDDEPVVRAELERLGGQIVEHTVPAEIVARLQEANGAE